MSATTLITTTDYKTVFDMIFNEGSTYMIPKFMQDVASASYINTSNKTKALLREGLYANLYDFSDAFAKQYPEVFRKNWILQSTLRRKYGEEILASSSSPEQTDSYKDPLVTIIYSFDSTTANHDGIINNQIKAFNLDFELKATEVRQQLVALALQSSFPLPERDTPQLNFGADVVKRLSTSQLQDSLGINGTYFKNPGDGLADLSTRLDVEWIIHLLYKELQGILNTAVSLAPPLVSSKTFSDGEAQAFILKNIARAFSKALTYVLVYRENSLKQLETEFESRYQYGQPYVNAINGISNPSNIPTFNNGGPIANSIAVNQIRGFRRNYALKYGALLGSYLGMGIQAQEDLGSNLSVANLEQFLTSGTTA